MTLTFATTSLAIPRGSSLCGYLSPRVFGRVFMPALAMRFSLLPFGVCQSANSKTVQNAKFVNRKHFVQRIPFMKSGKQSVDMNTRSLRPLLSRQGNAVVCDSDIHLSVVRLFFSRRPSAIFRAIRAVVINPIKRCAKRSFAHIFNKISKQRPAFAHANTSRPMPVISGVFGVRTTLLNGLPNSVQIGLRLTMTALHDASVLQWSEKVK